MKARRHGFLLALLLAPAFLSGEELRTLVAGTAALGSEASEGLRFSLGYNEALAILIPADSPFIQGFEIEVKSPPAALALPGALAYELWRRVDPMPEKSRFGYEGDRILTQPLPNRAGFVIQVPTRKDHGLKTSPYATLIPTVIETKDLPFVFRLFPVTKGLPAELEQASFQVRVRPLLTDEGGLRLSIRYPESAERLPLALSIDDKRQGEPRLIEPKELFVLKAGNHFLRLSSEAFRDETRSFAVEQGKILELQIELEGTAPLLIFEAPDSAQVLLDGVKFNHVVKPSLTVEPGEHNLALRIGDYTLTRKFTAFRGKTYRIVLSVDLQVQEGP